MPAPASSMLSVAVESRRRSCVLDPTLALSRHGLVLAQRLSTEFDLWVAREFWTILDNPISYDDHPGVLAHDHGARAEIIKQAMRQWDVARSEKDLAGLNLYWLNDALGTSLLPSTVDPQLLVRFETLARAAEDLPVDVEADPVPPELESCVRDTLALSVALSSHRAFVLTGWDEPAGSGAPAFCQLLQRWRIRSDYVDQPSRAFMTDTFFGPLFARAGVTELMWAGLRLAAVHIVAPRAAAVASFGAGHAPWADPNESEPEGYWNDAIAFWYPLSWSHP